jgi:hypothetical protein
LEIAGLVELAVDLGKEPIELEAPGARPVRRDKAREGGRLPAGSSGAPDALTMCETVT